VKVFNEAATRDNRRERGSMSPAQRPVQPGTAGAAGSGGAGTEVVREAMAPRGIWHQLPSVRAPTKAQEGGYAHVRQVCVRRQKVAVVA